jgi:hypothetical protein
MKSAALVVSLILFGTGQAFAATGSWTCIANSTYGTHGTSSHWSSNTGSRQGAEASAISKCVAFAVNKRDCRVNRCWVGRD